MIGYVVGVILGVIVFLIQNFKPTSAGFRFMFLLVSIAFLIGIYFAHINYLNILIIPIGELFLCFISAFCFPYDGKTASMEYEVVNGENYYANLYNKDVIGEIHPRGFKQTYDRIMGGILYQIVNNPKELQLFGNLLYSKNFYPISIHTKEEVLQHIINCIEKTASSSRHGDMIRNKANEKMEQIFNTYVSVMAIHEEATKNIERIKQEY